MKIKRLLIITTVCAACLYVCIMQMSFVIADKSARSCSYSNGLEAVNANKVALKYNRYNPLYRLNIGFNYAAVDSLTPDVFQSLINGDSLQLHYIDSSYAYMKAAYWMYPEEPVFAVNYALAEIVKGDTYSAVDALKRYLPVEDNSCELLCVLGLGYEIIGVFSLASDIYTRVISYFPEVSGSHFFADLQSRDSLMAASIIDGAIDNLHAQFEKTEDPIVAAKLGKLLFETGDIDKAEEYLLRAVGDLPSLNRPWYYLGLIKEMKGKEEEALTYYKRSYSLDNSDILPLSKMVSCGEPYQDLLDYLVQNKMSNQSHRISRLFGGYTLRYPYIVSDLEQYFSR